MSLKEDQEELKTGEKKSNTVKMNDDDEDDDEKTKISFRLGEGISPRDTLAVQGTVPVLEQLKQTSIQKVKDAFVLYFKYMNFNFIKAVYFTLILSLNFVTKYLFDK